MRLVVLGRALLIGALPAVGCAAREPAIRAQFAAAWGCPEPSITVIRTASVASTPFDPVERSSRDHHDVSGCGYHATVTDQSEFRRTDVAGYVQYETSHDSSVSSTRGPEDEIASQLARYGCYSKPRITRETGAAGAAYRVTACATTYLCSQGTGMECNALPKPRPPKPRCGEVVFARSACSYVSAFFPRTVCHEPTPASAATFACQGSKSQAPCPSAGAVGCCESYVGRNCFYEGDETAIRKQCEMENATWCAPSAESPAGTFAEPIRLPFE